jgi:hypothetical protein
MAIERPPGAGSGRHEPFWVFTEANAEKWSALFDLKCLSFQSGS